MRRRVAAGMVLGPVLILVGLYCSWQRKSPEPFAEEQGRYSEQQLLECLYLPVHEVVRRLSLDKVVAEFPLDESNDKWIVEEPPGCIRGVQIWLPDRGYVMILLATDDPMFFAENAGGKIGYKKLAASRVGGIQYKQKSIEVNVGEVPFQWCNKNRKKVTLYESASAHRTWEQNRPLAIH